MSTRRPRKVQKKGFVDYKLSSGDSPRICNTITEKIQEENNNEVDGLSKDLEMGCIVDGVKRPPNICVETCVYDERDETEGTNSNETLEEGEDAYSDDDFEDYSSDEEESNQIEPKEAHSNVDNRTEQPQTDIKLSKSHSFMSSKDIGNGSVSGKSVKSSKYGSLTIPRTQRVNMSFTNDRLREIERHNHILLNKILCARNVTKSSIPPAKPPPAPRRPPPAAALRRKKQQREIDYENMILLRKIQRAKSSSCSFRR